ncbi:MAG TPA: hypothetical protein VFA74_09205 [Terriglobales bacterium]|nr:hypothetical protein [Terriglobales bacterium]
MMKFDTTRPSFTLEEVSKAARRAKGLPAHDFRFYGKLGGLSKTDAKQKAAKKNGKKGGRPVRNPDED